MMKFRDLFQGREGITVPKVFKEFSTSKVLVTEFVEGSPLGKATILPQEYRDSVHIYITKIRLQKECLDFVWMSYSSIDLCKLILIGAIFFII